MIFDSRRARNLIAQFTHSKPWDRPYWVVFATTPEFGSERGYVEHVLTSAPRKHCIRWSKGLLTRSNATFVATWFEVMLFGWLREFISVTIEPTLRSGHPDFLVEINDREIYIEAAVYLLSEEERAEGRYVSQVFSLIRTLHHPYLVNVNLLDVQRDISERRFLAAVGPWLSNSPTRFFF